MNKDLISIDDFVDKCSSFFTNDLKFVSSYSKNKSNIKELNDYSKRDKKGLKYILEIGLSNKDQYLVSHSMTVRNIALLVNETFNLGADKQKLSTCSLFHDAYEDYPKGHLDTKNNYKELEEDIKLGAIASSPIKGHTIYVNKIKLKRTLKKTSKKELINILIDAAKNFTKKENPIDILKYRGLNRKTITKNPKKYLRRFKKEKLEELASTWVYSKIYQESHYSDGEVSAVFMSQQILDEKDIVPVITKLADSIYHILFKGKKKERLGKFKFYTQEFSKYLNTELKNFFNELVKSRKKDYSITLNKLNEIKDNYSKQLLKESKEYKIKINNSLQSK